MTRKFLTPFSVASVPSLPPPGEGGFLVRLSSDGHLYYDKGTELVKLSANPIPLTSLSQFTNDPGYITATGGTFTGQITSSKSTGVIGTSNLGSRGIEVWGSGTGHSAFMVFHRPGEFAAAFGIDADNKWKVGGWSMGANAYALYHEGNKPTLSQLSNDAGYINWAATQGTGSDVGTDLGVSRLLRWKHYGNNHVIFDASNGTSPGGSAISNTDSEFYWSATCPTLMGWNGNNTYGVRVDRARYADSAGSIDWSGVSNRPTSLSQLTNDSGYITSGGSVSRIDVLDGDRNAGTKLPIGTPHGVRFDFVNAPTANSGGNYAGVMTISPWDGTTGSTGDASYQLSFGSTASNGGGIPKLSIRKGIDSTWNSWYEICHTGNLNPTSYSCTYTNGLVTGITEVISGVTYTSTIAYNGDGTVRTMTRVGGGKTRTETYSYSAGTFTGMTSTEV